MDPALERSLKRHRGRGSDAGRLGLHARADGGDLCAVRLLDGDALVCGATSGRPRSSDRTGFPIGDNLSGHAMRSGRFPALPGHREPQQD